MAKRQIGKAVVAITLVCGLQLAAAAPASALKTLSGSGVTFSGGSSMTLFGAKPAPDVVLNARFTPPQDVSAVPEPAGWLMMLLGFGLLGVITRRGAPTPVEIQNSI